MKKHNLLLTVLFTLLATSCSYNNKNQNFSEAHDAFETKIVKQSNDQDEVPEPPQGIFDLVAYESKVGKLAAYVSSDPGDGEKHPIMIWIVGGWSNGIDEFPWSYAPWDNDQSAAAFREAGILMMYPSFRGANGNPGYYETLFGEIDDIASAYEYVASLPYVDPNRIYLGGHSTGGTKALLASEYMDRFRAVFSFGPVDQIKYHNNSEFTFDIGNKEEYKMRSPIYWLNDIKSPTFIIEGEDGNSLNVKNIEKKSENNNIYCYVIDDADHFSVLAPITRLLAQKILGDTGDEPNITLTDQELQNAMLQPPIESLPIMQLYKNKEAGFQLLMPAIWKMNTVDQKIFDFSSQNKEDNFWDTSCLFIETYDEKDKITLKHFIQELNNDGSEYQGKTIEINKKKAYVAECVVKISNGNNLYKKVIAIKNNKKFIACWFYTSEVYKDSAIPMFDIMIDSITLN